MAKQTYSDKLKNIKWVKAHPVEDTLPKLPACYVFYIDGKLSYVGSTFNLHNRMSSHKIKYGRYTDMIYTPWGRFKDVNIKYKLSLNYGDWAMHEIALIKKLSPPLNKKQR